MSDIVQSLEAAANTIYEIGSEERRRLILAGIETVNALRARLFNNGDILPIEPGFMSDMPALAAIAGQDDVVEVLVSAGMLMLAGEISRLRSLEEVT